MRFIYSNCEMFIRVVYLIFENVINSSSVYLLMQMHMHVRMDTPYNCVLFLDMLVTSDTAINKVPKCTVAVSMYHNYPLYNSGSLHNSSPRKAA
jgi:hypothetical protein